MILFFSLPLYAQYDNAILKVQATILPKIVFMDYGFKEKIYDNKILIEIICDINNNSDAVKFKQMILDKYKDGINGYKIEINIVNSVDINKKLNKKTIYYLFPTTKNKIKQIINSLQYSNAIIFSFDKEDLSYGSNISINIGKKIKPILNMSALKKKNISLKEALINISEIYYKESK
jgi:hypothetical protein